MRDWFDSEVFVPREEQEVVDFKVTSAGQLAAPDDLCEPPSVDIVARRFKLTEDLRIETQLRCWAIAEQRGLEGPIKVTFSADALSDWQEVYTAAVEISEPLGPIGSYAMGADPYEALARALGSM